MAASVKGHLGRRIVIVVVCLLATTLFATPAFACDPLPPPPPEESLEEATAVFSGQVTAMDERGDDPVDATYEVHFDVERVWKGVETTEVVVETHVDQGVCGFPFEIGESYLVYASGEPDQLETALFHRTKLIERADEDLAALGEGTPIEQIAPGVVDSEQDTSPNPWLLAGLFGLTTVLVAVVIVIRRGKSESEVNDLN